MALSLLIPQKTIITISSFKIVLQNYVFFFVHLNLRYKNYFMRTLSFSKKAYFCSELKKLKTDFTFPVLSGIKVVRHN